MKLPFRQGIVDAQKNGLGQPQFILLSSTPGYVQLSATISPTTIAVAHGSSDYLFTFNQNVDPAWGPMVPGVNNYLYWNVDVQTAAVTYGITTLEPIASTEEPTAPQVDQHWFDLSTTTMKVWTGAKWQVRVRLFAGMVPNGNLSSNPAAWCYPLYQPWVAASQLQVESNPGYIMTNIFGQPQYLSGASLEFMTSKTPVRFNTTVGTAGILSQPTNAIFPVKASENIPALSIVYFSGENSVGLASGNPAVDPPKTPVGIVQSELAPGEMGILHQSGEISSDTWNWSEHIGKPLYCGDFGTIVTHRPAGLLAYRIGFVKSRTTIVFQVDAETQPQVYQAGPSDVVVSAEQPLTSTLTTSPLGERIWTVAMPAASGDNDGYMTGQQAYDLQDARWRINGLEQDILNRSLIGHTHLISSVTGLQTALDGKSNVGHTHSLATLSDVDTTTSAPATGNALVWSGTRWVPGEVAATSVISAIPPLGVDIATGEGGVSTWIVSMPPASIENDGYMTGQQAYALQDLGLRVSGLEQSRSINDLSDVDTETSAPASGNALVFNGSQWVPGTVAAPAIVKPAPLATTTTTATALDIGSAAHHNTHYRCSASTDVAITVKPDSFWTGTDDYTANGYNPLNPGPMPTGGNLIFTKASTGNVIFVAAPGVTINTPDTLSISRLNGKATLIKVGANTWDLEGNIGLAEGQTSYTLPDAYYSGTIQTGKTVLLLHGDSLLDSSTAPKTLAVNGAVASSTVQSKFGGSALSFDGEGSYLRVASDSDLLLNANDFTVEAFIYATEVAGASGGKLRHVFTQSETLVGNFTYWYCLAVGPLGRLYNYVSTSNTSFSTPEGTIQPNTWYHVAFVRSGTTAKVFVNGSLVASTNAWSTYPNDKVAYSGVGGVANGYGDSTIGTFKGYIDELRVTNGVARYVADFTPPTAPFANGLA